MWPDHFPNDCPPNDSRIARGTYYRLVSHNPLSQDDFVPSNSTPPDDFGDPECIKCGISVFNSLQAITKTKDRYPRKFASSSIAVGILRDGMGKIKNTPSSIKSHYTWWLPKGFSPMTIFSVLQEQPGDN